MSDKKRHTIWIDERIWEDVLSHYKSDNCSTQNEFVENALRFYIGYLNTKNAGAFLPQAISSVMNGTMYCFTALQAGCGAEPMQSHFGRGHRYGCT